MRKVPSDEGNILTNRFEHPCETTKTRATGMGSLPGKPETGFRISGGADSCSASRLLDTVVVTDSRQSIRGERSLRTESVRGFAERRKRSPDASKGVLRTIPHLVLNATFGVWEAAARSVHWQRHCRKHRRQRALDIRRLLMVALWIINRKMMSSMQPQFFFLHEPPLIERVRRGKARSSLQESRGKSHEKVVSSFRQALQRSIDPQCLLKFDAKHSRLFEDTILCLVQILHQFPRF